MSEGRRGSERWWASFSLILPLTIAHTLYPLHKDLTAIRKAQAFPFTQVKDYLPG